VSPFDTTIEEAEGLLCGPWRAPQQMLSVQQYDGHTSIHDDATAQQLGFKGGTIEGPTHFSQFAPLAVAAFGMQWLAAGCISAHYRAPVFAGERVRAFLRRPDASGNSEIWMARTDGTEILKGSASLGPHFPASALERRLGSLSPLIDPLILADVRVGMRSRRTSVRMDREQHMGPLYPFSLAQKLKVITEPSPLYESLDHQFGRPLIPLEMVSVLMQYTAREDSFAARGPAVGLFADQEVRMLEGPLFVGEAYEVEREIVFLSGSRRTESMWVRSTLFCPGGTRPLASMLLNLATLKESYAPYTREYRERYGRAPEA
jgi:hypothetical protein